MKQNLSFTRWTIPFIIILNFLLLIIQFLKPFPVWFMQIIEFFTVSFLICFLFRIKYKVVDFRKQALDEIMHDSLTSLPTRLKLEKDYLNHEDECSLAFGDVDNFKFINDSLGHKIGDAVLKEIAIILNRTVKSGTVYRWGGDEFVILFPNKNKKLITEDLLHVMQIFSNPIEIDEFKLHISMSFGVVDASTYNSDLSEMLRLADIAMYDVKHKGKSSFEFYNPKQDYKILNMIKYDQITKNMDFINDTVLYYQPRFNFSNNQMSGLEVLIRIKDKKNPFLPQGFIAAAERNGRIRDLDYSVIKRALKFQAKLREQGYIVQLAINISGVTFNYNLLTFLQTQFQKYNTIPSTIELEITESVSIFIDENMLDLFQQLKKLGINILLDDFGKKYSSLENISKLPIDHIKIDYDFISNVHLSNVKKIVQSIIQLAKSMNISVIAEGIETQEQYDLLKKLGCDIFQGYLFERPIDENKVIHRYFDEKE